jgi:hypothetical protein
VLKSSMILAPAARLHHRQAVRPAPGLATHLLRATQTVKYPHPGARKSGKRPPAGTPNCSFSYAVLLSGGLSLRRVMPPVRHVGSRGVAEVSLRSIHRQA